MRVQAPLTPAGRLRNGTGRWRFRQTGRGVTADPWDYADSVHDVVDWLCTRAGC